MTRTDSRDIIRIHKVLYTISGIWPSRSPSLFLKIRYYTSWILAFGLVAVMYTESIVEGGDFIKLSKILFIQISATSYIVKMANFVYHGQEFLDMMDYLDSSIFHSYPVELDIHIRRAKKFNNVLSSAFLGSTAFVVFMLGVTPFVSGQTFPVPFPYNLKPYNNFMYVFQMLGIAAAAWNHNVLDVLTAGVIHIGIAHLDILGDRIRYLNQGGKVVDQVKVREEVLVCINHHQAIIK